MFFFFQAEDGIRDIGVTGVQTCALPILAMLDRALEAGVPIAWVTGDSVYGADHRIRRRLAARQRGYVLAVTSGQRLGSVPVENWLAKVPPEGWERLSAGDGAKGPRLYDWAHLPHSGAAAGWR